MRDSVPLFYTRPHFFSQKIISFDQRTLFPVRPTVFKNSVHAPAQCLEAFFSAPDRFLLQFPLVLAEVPAFRSGSSQGAKCTPAGRPGAGRDAALHVSGLPGGSPQPSRPLIGFRTGAYLGLRASFRLVGAEQGYYRTMAPVNGEDCNLETSGEGGACAQGTWLGMLGSRHD